jgi:hypothetical protein
MINPQEILDRIKTRENIKKEKDLASFLGITPSALGMWRKREKFEFSIILQRCEKYDLNWLITGENRGNPAETKELLKEMQKKIAILQTERDKYHSQVQILKEIFETFPQKTIPDLANNHARQGEIKK